MNDQARILISLTERELNRVMEQRRHLRQLTATELASCGLRSHSAAMAMFDWRIQEHQNRLRELMDDIEEDE